MIKATLQTVKVNDYGFASIKAGGAWYGADKKGFRPDAQEGDLVEFEGFKNPKGYDTYKTQSFKKLAKEASAESSAGNGGQVSGSVQRVASKPVGGFSAGSRDTYWADKDANDKLKDPRISYFASLERAIQFVDLALRNGAIGAYQKAKETGKLEVLTALVYETTQRIMSEAYAQTAPGKEEIVKALVADYKATAALESDPEESWG